MVIHTGNKYGTINKLLRTRRIIPYFLAANILMLICAGWVPSAQAGQSFTPTAPTQPALAGN